MAGSGGRPVPDLIQDLLNSPQDFDFFQAVRIIELYVAEGSEQTLTGQIGGDRGPQSEPVAFKALPSLSFPPGQIAALAPRDRKDRAALRSGDATEVPLPLDMTVSFMGLTGPNGVLPSHYTTLLIERSHARYKDHTLREFFDLFNHRSVSLFYRAWEKYHFPYSYERSQQSGEYEDDLFTRCLFSLAGLEIPGLRHRFLFDDQTMVFYGGLFSQRCRNASGLEQIVEHYFQVEAEVIQFCGQWLYLPEDTQSSMPSKQHRDGLNLELGQSAVVGSRVWDVQSRVRIRLGPLTLDEFYEFLPGGQHLECLSEIIRFYLGLELDFDVQLVLRKEDVPPCELSAGPDFQPRLGWNTWMASDSLTKDSEDAVFRF
ncbi:type VI secretion system baseplate subunit TssG [Fuerstiella marisgermanici]|uniref:Type VI secretion protein, family n=1 Tax=Fuerstiella marisgermanici TaxID=1891926 RepID=A0A1P8WE70_9PLAN|nr:type VI secretion system baseplate subunit TssG [Fuerstiella marisgermanici]APZ92332.1 type VI secretion protein, family [Fuerstiella marisgermanici]